MGKTGVVLLAFGGADTVEDVEPFIKNVLKGRPLTPEFVEKAKDRYRRIGGSSPLLKITREQAKALEEVLNKNGDGYKAFVGMRYWRPYIKDALKEMTDSGIEEAIAVIMAPHSSRASTGGYLTAVEEALNETSDVSKIKIKFVEDWHTHPLYISAVTEKIEEALSSSGVPKEEVFIIFSAHSLPLASLEGDPYVDKLNGTITEVLKKLPFDFKSAYSLAFQSKGGGGKWLEPEVQDVIKEARDAGKKAVLVAPLGFVADHVETLYDIDIFFKETARALGIKFLRAASLNASKPFIEMLSDVVVFRARKKNPQ